MDIPLHTPGPWKVDSRRTTEGRFIITAGSYGEQTVAQTEGTLWVSDDFLTKTKANASLIASAPDLLAERDDLKSALTAILFQLNQGKVFERDACVAEARAVIKKYQTPASPKE